MPLTVGERELPALRGGLLALGAALSVTGYLLARPVLSWLVLRAKKTRLRPLITAVPVEQDVIHRLERT